MERVASACDAVVALLRTYTRGDALVDIGYQGFVGHEFIPTRDPLAGLTQAIRLCDV